MSSYKNIKLEVLVSNVKHNLEINKQVGDIKCGCSMKYYQTTLNGILCSNS